MADAFRMALEELLRKAQMDGDVDFLRDDVQTLAQAVMDLEVSQQVGAEPCERTAARTGGNAMDRVTAPGTPGWVRWN